MINHMPYVTSRSRIDDITGDSFLLILASYCALVSRLTARTEFSLLLNLRIEGRDSSAGFAEDSEHDATLLNIRVLEGETFETLVRELRKVLSPACPAHEQHSTLRQHTRVSVQADASGDNCLATFRWGLAPQEGNESLISVAAIETDGAIQLTVQCSRSHFSLAPAADVAVLLRTIVHCAAAAMDTELSDCDWVPSEQKHTLLTWRGASAPDGYENIVSRMETHARHHPQVPAVVCDGQTITYGELDVHSAAIADGLRRAGAHPGDVVAIVHERTLNLIPVLLGVLRARCVYCPVAPDYPDDRIHRMLDSATIRFALVSKTAKSRFETVHRPVVVVCVDELLDGHSAAPTQGALEYPRSSDRAYVLFTSGSTGEPKGVVIEHGSLSNFLRWSRDYFTADRLRTVLATSALSFDLSVFEIFAPLFAGGTVVLIKSALHLFRSLTNQSALLAGAPSVVGSLLLAQRIPHSVETIVMSGEPVKAELVAALRKQLPRAAIYNCYGPTETTVFSTASALHEHQWQHAPVGRPIANTQVYVLDSRQRLMPFGVTGEIHIGGSGLAREYMAQPEMTQERFMHNPFGPGRLYRTGDLGRFEDDSTLVVLGRLDHQIKIRGFRVELGEIETHVQGCPGVAQCAATVIASEAGDQLAVYYTSVDDRVDEAQIRAHLKLHLPPYMIPALIARVHELPLNESGKVARRLLGKLSTYSPDVAGMSQ